mmetsp:Transcript_17360/g.20141  ORF Transcript_17360/g.20141 Transcript_17360/m.20141 type:complete len:168 (-) Transcript_17360:488-991(-)
MFIKQNYKVINECMNSTFWNIALRKWFGIRMSVISSVIIIFTSTFLLCFKDQADPVLVGAMFLHALWICNNFKWGSMCLTEVDANIMSYARCKKMLEIAQEAPQKVETFNHTSWPHTGKIEFSNYYLKYRPDTEFVLKKISFTIRNREKIGVVGRTGAGKSTLCLAL